MKELLKTLIENCTNNHNMIVSAKLWDFISLFDSEGITPEEIKEKVWAANNPDYKFEDKISDVEYTEHRYYHLYVFEDIQIVALEEESFFSTWEKGEWHHTDWYGIDAISFEKVEAFLK